MHRQTPEEVSQQRRFSLYGERVMPDADLVLLYGIEIATQRRPAPIRRRRLRFPDDFMFN